MQVNNARTQLNMVIGYPLTHTQSPCLHHHLYEHLNLNAVLLAFAHPKIEPLMQAIKTLKVGLTAVTIPFKETVIKHLDNCDAAGQAIGAINTIILRKGKLYGYNTDVSGIAYALEKITLKDKSILIIGAGGAARAAGYLMQQKGANIFWLNRTRERAEKLSIDFSGTVIDHAQLKKISIDVIINTTPLGMYPNEKRSPLPHYQFNSSQVVFDMAYNPMDTLLLLSAKQSNAKTVSGINMFLGQGIRQVELWTDQLIHPSEALLMQLKKLLIEQQVNVIKGREQ